MLILPKEKLTKGKSSGLRQRQNGEISFQGKVINHPACGTGNFEEGSDLAVWPAPPPRGRLCYYSRPGAWGRKLLLPSLCSLRPQNGLPLVSLITLTSKNSRQGRLQGSPCSHHALLILLQLVLTDLQHLLIPPQQNWVDWVCSVSFRFPHQVPQCPTWRVFPESSLPFPALRKDLDHLLSTNTFGWHKPLTWLA